MTPSRPRNPAASLRFPVTRGTGRLVALLGILLCAAPLVTGIRELPIWAAIVLAAALLVWAALVLLPARISGAPRLAALIAMSILGAISSAASHGIGLVPAAVGIVTVIGAPGVPLLAGGALALLVLGCLALTTILDPELSLLLIGIVCTAASGLIGFSRRQARQADDRERRTSQELVAAHRALALSAARDERARIARDLHDVLAHSLGGVVMQLDAVEALAEAGRAEDAAARARTARLLAAEGLREARAAVEVLGDSSAVPLRVLSQRLRGLVEQNRDLGVAVTADIEELRGEGAPALVSAFHEAAREAITNARKHAQGRAVQLTLESEDDMILLTVANPPGTPSEWSGTGSRRGIPGMRARFAALAGGSVSVDAGPEAFIIRARAERS